VEREVGVVGFGANPLPFYLMEWVPPMIEFDEVRHVNLISVFPGVVAFGVSFPFDEILQGFAMSLMLVGMDLIHFILLFSFDQVRRGLGKVWAMCESFMIGQ
jgi:hypothetical protein